MRVGLISVSLGYHGVSCFHKLIKRTAITQVQKIVPILIPSYGPSYEYKMSSPLNVDHCREAYMIKDISIKDCWNRLDLALCVRCVVVACSRQKIMVRCVI